MMKQERVLLCEDYLEGILSAIHEAYLSRYGHNYICIEIDLNCERRLFVDYHTIQTDYDKAGRVADAIKKKISPGAFEMIHLASLSCYQDKAQAIYNFVQLGFTMGETVVSHLSNDWVNRIFRLQQEVSRETQKFRGFVRFHELPGRILFSKIAPKHEQLFLLGDHFADRFPEENWIIYDERRQQAAVHEARQSWNLIYGIDPRIQEIAEEHKTDDVFLELWKLFVKRVTIKERENRRLQMNFMPKRYWSNLPEMEAR